MECRLYSCDDSSSSIFLPDREKIVLGRGPLTKIKDKKCSREQVEVVADYESKEIEIKQIGRNPSAVGTILVNKGGRHVLGPGGVFSFLQGKHKCSVQFIDASQPPMEPYSSPINDGKVKENRTTTLFKALRQSSSQSKLQAETNKNIINDLESVTVTPDSSSRKRKSEEQDQNIVSSLKKLRRSLTGHLMDCFSTEDQKDIDIKELQFKLIDKEEEDATSGDNTRGLEEITEKAKVENKPNCKPEIETHKSCEPIQNKVVPRATENKWTTQDGILVFCGKGLEARSKISGFDLDGTLITTMSGKVFPTGPDDWKLLFGNIKSKLRKLYDEGYKVTIFTNQKGLGKFKVSVQGFKDRIEKIQDRLEIPLQCFVATKTDHYRKPATGMWAALNKDFNSGVNINMKNSFYVGDAAGRPVGWSKGRKKDFSFADRCFAANLGLEFQTPEEFFLNWNQATFAWPQFNPKEIPRSLPLLHSSSSTAELSRSIQEIILMVGFPACGKTTFAKNSFVLHGYEHVNRDTLATWQKCVASCQVAVGKGKSIVVDNTNPDKKTRKRYIDLASEKSIPVRCFVMTTSLEQSQFNNKFRELTTNDKNYKAVGPVAFHNYKNAYQEPQLAEGFQEIVKVNFVPSFSDKNHEKLYFSFL